MTADALKAYTLKDLGQLAKKRGVHGWHSMKKDQLVKALMKAAAKPRAALKAPSLKSPSKRQSRGTPVRATATRAPLRTARTRTAAAPVARSRVAVPLPPPVAATGGQRTRALKRLKQAKDNQGRSKNLAGPRRAGQPEGFTKDRLIAMVRDPFWIHAYWELTRQGVSRAEAALGQEWHLAKPVLRLLEVAGNGTTSNSEKVLRNIEIHGEVNNWYVDVQDPPKSYRLDIGYLGASGKFFALARSNVVSTPKAGASDTIDKNWSDVAENFDKIYAMSGGYSDQGPGGDLQQLFEERLRRPMGSPMVTKFGAGVNGNGKHRNFHFEVDAELIVYGSTAPGAHVTLQGDPVKLRPDGTFTVRFSLPNCRQVIPAVASSSDGMEQRTVVLAVERNTKTMEPLVRDGNE